MKQRILIFECLDKSRYELFFHDGGPATKLFSRMRKRADKNNKGTSRAAHGALELRRVKP